MFYSQFILAKKGPLGTIWIAAHLERKLRKNQVAETDIGVTVDSILFPDVPIALRLSGHLLLGVVRVYSRQVNYLFNDCSETLVKIKQAFRSTAVDLPPEATTAPFHAITLPETFDFDELELLADSESAYHLSSSGKHVDRHVTTREQITLQDNTENNPYLGSSQFELDERFGDGNCSSMTLDFDEEFLAEKAYSGSASASTPLLKEDTIPPLTDDAMQMDIDDPYATFEPQHNDNNIVADCEEPVVFRIDQNHGDDKDEASLSRMLEPDRHGDTSAPYLEPPTASTMVEAVLSPAACKTDVLNFHAYTPYTEACTPDLNLEFRPLDEPSTPALLDEASFSMYKESSIENHRKIPPGVQENAESNNNELQPAPLSPDQITLSSVPEKPNQQISSAQLVPSSPTLGLHHADGADAVAQSSSPFAEGAASCERPELGHTGQGFTFDNNPAVEMSNVAVVPSENDEMNQILTVGGSEAQLSITGSIRQEVVPSQINETTLRTQSLSQNIFQHPTASPHDQIVQNDTTGQAFPSVQNVTISASTAVESVSLANAKAADLSVETSTTAKDSDSARDLVWLDVADVPECETLRSVADCGQERRGMLLLEKNMLDESIPALELEHVKSGSENCIVTGQPELYETPVLKDQTPHTVLKDSPLSSGYLDRLPGDDDVLASILGRRKSSAFKVASTPIENVVVKKRRITSKSISKKRRNDFDTLPVLHGDVIRQQLADTEDIRRERHKAPCTRQEIWYFNKEVEGQQNFDEPSIPGLSNELHDLFEDVLNGFDSGNMLANIHSSSSIQAMKPADSTIDTNINDRSSLPSESRDSSKVDFVILDRSGVEGLPNHLEGNTETTPDISNENSERFQCLRSNPQETEHYEGEFPSINQYDSCINSMQSSDMPVQVETSAKEEHDALERPEKRQQEAFECTTIDEGADIEHAQCSPEGMGNGNIDGEAGEGRMLVEATPVSAEDTMQHISPELFIQSAGQTEDTMQHMSHELFIQNAGQTEDTMQHMSHELFIQNAGQAEDIMQHISPGLFMQSVGQAEDNMQHTSPELFMQSAGQAEDSMQHTSPELLIQTAGHVGIIHTHELTVEGLLQDAEKDATNLSTLEYQEHVDVPVVAEAQLESREDDRIHIDTSNENLHTPISDGEPSDIMENAGNTDFLADDDDDMDNAEIYEDSGDEQDPSILENSGWSVRTRNVGRYLKSVFEEMEGTRNRMHQEHPTLGLERLLARKTRKEAARMFFETLVLKTRDYIHVEQKLAYEDIHLYPKPKLMKNNF